VNGTLSTTDMKTIAEELGQIYEQAVSLGNDQLNGKYIFNGQFTDKQPYTSAAASTQSTDDQQIVYQFAAGVKVPINVNGNDVFGAPSDSDNLFAVIKGLQQSFDNGDQTAAQGLMSKLQSRFDTFLGVRADVGARSNRIDLIDSRIKDLDINLTELDSKIEDADIAETITKLQTEQSVYQASLSVGAKVIQPSLLDYLR
jgi:flagellar hook-associated protein 3 FlgL